MEPELLFKMLFLGYQYGISIKVKLTQALNESIVFKWFLGLKLTEKGLNNPNISVNRIRVWGITSLLN